MRYLLQEDRENLDALLDKYAEAKAIQDNPSLYMHPEERDCRTGIVHYICERRLGFPSVEAYFREVNEPGVYQDVMAEIFKWACGRFPLGYEVNFKNVGQR